MHVVRDGKVQAKSVEINIAYHCNLSCKACDHISAIAPRTFIEPAGAIEDARRLARHYYAENVKLIGGEPLLHPRVLEFATGLRVTGIAGAVQLITNGVLLPRQGDDLWRTFDAVVVSSYPGRELEGEALAHCQSQALKHNVRLSVRPVPTFRQSHAGLGTADESLRQRIYDSCSVAHVYRCHTLAEGVFYKCPQAFFMPRQLDCFAGSEPTADGLALDDGPAFRDRLLADLNSRAPLAACGRCLGTAGKTFPHHQAPRPEWAQGHDKTAEEMVDPTALTLKRPSLSRQLRWKAKGAVRRAQRLARSFTQR